jgi:hypothetical protein
MLASTTQGVFGMAGITGMLALNPPSISNVETEAATETVSCLGVM